MILWWLRHPCPSDTGEHKMLFIHFLVLGFINQANNGLQSASSAGTRRESDPRAKLRGFICCCGRAGISECLGKGCVTTRAEIQSSQPTPVPTQHQTDLATGRFSKMHSEGLIPSTLNSWECSPWLQQVSEEVSGVAHPPTPLTSPFHCSLCSEPLFVPAS